MSNLAPAGSRRRTLRGAFHGAAAYTFRTSGSLANGFRTLPRRHAPASGQGVVPQMSNEAALRRLARIVLENGQLPSRDPDRTWGGPGIGAPCAVCGHSVAPDQVEYEVQFARDGGSPGLDRFHLHLRCFAVWELERTKLP
jgi:hypothetical protein